MHPSFEQSQSQPVSQAAQSPIMQSQTVQSQARQSTGFQRSDAELIQGVARKELAAYEILYDRYANQLYSLVCRIVQDTAVADEVLQETFWQIWQSAPDYRGSGSTKAWIFQIARHRSLDEIRRRKARPQKAAIDVETAQHMEAEHGSSAEEMAEQQIDRQQILGALEHLPSEQRECLEMAYFEGLTQRQIAETVQVPVGTIKSRIRIGLQKLEHLLRSAGYP